MNQRILAFALSCLLLMAALPVLANEHAAVPYAFTFRNGITWASTMEDVQLLEQQTGGEEAEREEVGTFSGLIYENKRVSEFTAMLGFLFKDDVLQICTYGLTDLEGMDYVYLNAALTYLYGHATRVEAKEAFDFMFSISSMVSQEDVSDAQWWTLPDGTQILLGYFAPGRVYILYMSREFLETRKSINTDGL